MALTHSDAWAQGKTAHLPSPRKSIVLRGSTVDCFNGTVYRIPNVDVVLYDADSNKDILTLLRRLDENISMDTQGKSDHFIELYNELVAKVESGRGRAKSSKSNRDGKFVLFGIAATKPYILLAIDLKSEDQLSHYAYKLINDSQSAYDMWLTPGAKQECKK